MDRKKIRTDKWKSIFLQHLMNLWHLLPQGVVMAASLDGSKRWLLNSGGTNQLGTIHPNWDLMSFPDCLQTVGEQLIEIYISLNRSLHRGISFFPMRNKNIWIKMSCGFIQKGYSCEICMLDKKILDPGSWIRTIPVLRP